jgi:hypothetical protein
MIAFASNNIHAQKNKLLLQIDYDIDARYKKEINKSYTNTFNDTISLYNEINTKLDAFWKSGFVNVYADSVVFKDNIATATIHVGKKFDSFFIIKTIYEDEKFSDKEFDVTNKKFNSIELGKLKEKIVQYYEQNSYPFASVKLDSVSLSDNIFSAILFINPHLKSNFDSINLIGTVKLNRKYLFKYIILFYPRSSVESLLTFKMKNRLILVA